MAEGVEGDKKGRRDVILQERLNHSLVSTVNAPSGQKDVFGAHLLYRDPVDESAYSFDRYPSDGLLALFLRRARLRFLRFRF